MTDVRRPVIGDMVIFMPPIDWQEKHGAGPWAAVVTQVDGPGTPLGKGEFGPVLLTAFPPGKLPASISAAIVYDQTGREFTWAWPRVEGSRGAG